MAGHKEFADRIARIEKAARYNGNGRGSAGETSKSLLSAALVPAVVLIALTVGAVTVYDPATGQFAFPSELADMIKAQLS